MKKCVKNAMCMTACFSIWTILVMGMWLIISMQPAYGEELEYRLHLGLWSEHYYNDRPDYNESNDLVQLSVHNHKQFFLTGGTFRNSHYARSHFLGIGREFQSEYIDDLKWGLYLAAVHGYEGHQETHAEGLIFAPVSYYKYKFFRLTIFGPAVNAGIEFKL